MDMSDEWARPGTMCACVADDESPGMSRLHVWVDHKVEPLGRVTEMGFRSICLLMMWAWSRMKWPEAPVSARAYCVVAGVGGGRL